MTIGLKSYICGATEFLDGHCQTFSDGIDLGIKKTVACSRRKCLAVAFYFVKMENIPPKIAFKSRLSDSEKSFILNSYKPGVTTVNSICGAIGRKKSTVSKFLKRSGVDVVTYSPPTQERVYSLREDYFERIDSRSKAYLLGFIFADGCVWKNERHFTMELAECDKEAILFLRTELQTDTPLRYKSPKESTYNGNLKSATVWVRICSKKICKDLISHGAVPVKSLILKPPIGVPKEFINSFILGYFDGDGSIFKSGNRDGVKILGTKEMLNFISKNIDSFLGGSRRKLFAINCKTKNSYCINWGGRVVCAKIREYLYEGCTFSLSRKRQKFYELGELTKRKGGPKPKIGNEL